MPGSKLEAKSEYGDAVLPQIKFVVHGTSNPADTAAILANGLTFIEGRPSVSTNLVHAHEWTTSMKKQKQQAGAAGVVETGSVIVVEVPPNLHLGYGIFTSAFVNRADKKVTGAPLRYAAARKQLAFYLDPDTTADRAKIETEISEGYSEDQRPAYIIEPRYVLGSFASTPGFDAVVKQLDVSIRSLEAVDTDRLEGAFRDLFAGSAPEASEDLPAALRGLINGTVESILISRLRMMRWQGLRALGYAFFEGPLEVQVSSVSGVDEQLRRIDEFEKRLTASALFSGELDWLKKFGASQLRQMRVELKGTELEMLPD